MMARKAVTKPQGGGSAEEERSSGARVSKETQGRGSAATEWWRIKSGVSLSRLLKMIVASLVLHVFLSPGAAVLGLFTLLPALDLSPREDIVEIELTSLPLGPTALEPGEEEVVPEEEAAKPSPEPPPEEEVAPEEPAAEPEPEEALEPEKSLEPDKPVETVPVSRPYGDPVALAGDAGAIADPNANVRLMIYADVVRKHSIGPDVASLLRRTPQWSDFFGPSKIDPIEDIDRVMIAGPQLRNSSQVVAVVQHRLPQERIDAAFGLLVKRDGSWVDKGARLARARADRASRLFSAPSENMVVVGPPSLEKQMKALKPGARFPLHDGKVAMTAYVVTPANVAKGTGIKIPKSIKWAKIDLRPSADGGGVFKLLALDKDKASATQNAALIEALLSQVTIVDNGKKRGGFSVFSAFSDALKVRLKSLKVKSSGNKIEGTLEFTKEQLSGLAELANMFLPPEKKGAREPAGSDPDADTSPAGLESKKPVDAAESSQPNSGTESSEGEEEQVTEDAAADPQEAPSEAEESPTEDAPPATTAPKSVAQPDGAKKGAAATPQTSNPPAPD